MGLAREAADTIALLETERDSSEAAQKSFVTEIDRLKHVVRNSEMRLRELQRGERIAAATERTQRLRHDHIRPDLRRSRRGGDAGAASHAPAATRRGRRGHGRDGETGDPAAMSRKLAEAGCGAPVATTGEAVLERLKKRAGNRV